MLNQTLKTLKSSILNFIDEETVGIEDAYQKLEEGESLSIAFSSKITPPVKENPDIELQVGISYVVERRKVRRILSINENQMAMEFVKPEDEEPEEEKLPDIEEPTETDNRVLREGGEDDALTEDDAPTEDEALTEDEVKDKARIDT